MAQKRQVFWLWFTLSILWKVVWSMTRSGQVCRLLISLCHFSRRLLGSFIKAAVWDASVLTQIHAWLQNINSYQTARSSAFDTLLQCELGGGTSLMVSVTVCQVCCLSSSTARFQKGGILSVCYQIVPTSAADCFTKGRAMCCHVYMTMHVIDP